MTQARWKQQIDSVNCPFCVPREDHNAHWSKIATLNASTLYLSKIQSYRGYCLLVLDLRHAVRISQLTPVEWESFAKDLRASQMAIETIVKPDHINVAALGNQIAHLHWHVIPRYQEDTRWGAPIWTTTEEEMKVTLLPADEFNLLADQIRAEIRRHTSQ